MEYETNDILQGWTFPLCETSVELLKKKTSWPLFMDGVQLPQGYRATTIRQLFS